MGPCWGIGSAVLLVVDVVVVVGPCFGFGSAVLLVADAVIVALLV